MERLAAAGVTLKLKKCMFATESMEYLGHQLSREGVRPVERLVTAVKIFPRPQNPVEVKRFVHLAGYYRKFVEAFGAKKEPMAKLLRKSVEWEWTEAQEFAFERMKAVLTAKPLLIYPNFEVPFQLVTDASKVGLGACLMQDAGNGLQPVAYASKVNSAAEANYSITELECLAVVWSVKLFRPYLYGRSFTIVTDHAALKWLMTRPNPAGRLHRWSLTLQEYEFEIVYRPGSTNVVADALSRAPAAVLTDVGWRTKWGQVTSPASEASEQERVSGTADQTAAAKKANQGGPAATRPLTRAAKKRADTQAEKLGEATVKVTQQKETSERVAAAEPLSPPPPAETPLEHICRSSTSKRRNHAEKPVTGARKRGTRGEQSKTPQVSEPPVNDDAVPLEPTLQLTDNEIMEAQSRSRLVRSIREAGVYKGMKVEQMYGITIIQTLQGRRVVLPVALWPQVFKECHDSVWAGHLRGPDTYARIAQLY
ncbi:hypothetical protein PR003_g2808 [Phytophthora rubi]|uniref:Reverse transcriptase RNase H-like domain-containing protein n=1 Tax=Phytophthora rubi TaxID=129364 RepID=A0A6A4G2G9_9STRA|nr:hypothetical protein PR002_g2750 [Phytophthora rubi]KAE9355509.1 hypothetical protein PR003_g2808 [Phytophthora rubi]